MLLGKLHRCLVWLVDDAWRPQSRIGYGFRSALELWVTSSRWIMVMDFGFREGLQDYDVLRAKQWRHFCIDYS